MVTSWAEKAFRIIFGFGILIIIGSFVIDDPGQFITALVVGIILIAYSLLEDYLLHKTVIAPIIKEKLGKFDVTRFFIFKKTPAPAVAEAKENLNLSSLSKTEIVEDRKGVVEKKGIEEKERIIPKRIYFEPSKSISPVKEEKIGEFQNTKKTEYEIAQTKIENKIEIGKREQVSKDSIADSTASEISVQDSLDLLVSYINDAVKSEFPKDKIKEAVLNSGWPESNFEEAYKKVTSVKRKKKIMVLISLVFALILFTIILNFYDAFLIPYWIKSLKYASMTFYISSITVLFAIILFLSLKIKSTLKVKSVEYRVQEEKTVEDIKETLKAGDISGLQTDIDKLYAIVKEKGKLRVSEVASAFGISKMEAEEWGKILKEQDLIILHYPTVGEPELIWKK